MKSGTWAFGVAMLTVGILLGLYIDARATARYASKGEVLQGMIDAMTKRSVRSSPKEPDCPKYPHLKEYGLGTLKFKELYPLCQESLGTWVEGSSSK